VLWSSSPTIDFVLPMRPNITQTRVCVVSVKVDKKKSGPLVESPFKADGVPRTFAKPETAADELLMLAFAFIPEP